MLMIYHDFNTANALFMNLFSLKNMWTPHCGAIIIDRDNLHKILGCIDNYKYSEDTAMLLFHCLANIGHTYTSITFSDDKFIVWQILNTYIYKFQFHHAITLLVVITSNISREFTLTNIIKIYHILLFQPFPLLQGPFTASDIHVFDLRGPPSTLVGVGSPFANVFCFDSTS